MTGTGKKPHKAVFEALSTGVAPAFLKRGFVRHPAYEDGWDPHNQEYTINLVGGEFGRYVFQLKIGYWPRYSEVRVEIIRSDNAFGIRSLEDFPSSAGHWTGLWINRPFTTLTLRSGNSWNPFSIKNAFKVRLRANRDPGAETARLVRAINKKLPYLFDAMGGSDCGRHVDVVHRHITRPAG